MRTPVLLFILKSEMDWHRNSRQAPWKLSSTDANRPTRSLRRIAGRNSGSWRLMAYPDITRKKHYVRLGGDPTATRN